MAKKNDTNIHEVMNKNRKKVVTFISLTVVASMILSLVAQFMMAF